MKWNLIFAPLADPPCKSKMVIAFEKVRAKFWWNRIIRKIIAIQLKTVPIPLWLLKIIFKTSVMYNFTKRAIVVGFNGNIIEKPGLYSNIFHKV